MRETYDLAVVGAGPVGLTAALKSALLFHTAVVLDKGKRTSRAFWVPNMDNIPGRPEGVSGRALMDDLRAQIEHAEAVAKRSFVTFRDGVEVARIARDGDAFVLEGRDAEDAPLAVRARVVVLATGVVDRQPYIGENAERPYDISAILPYANRGIADYCILCDGHTIKDKRIAVLGLGRGSTRIAKQLKEHFGASETVLVTCVPCVTGEAGHDHARHAELLEQVEAQGIPVIDKRIARLEGLKEDRIELAFDDGTSESFDRAWVAYAWYKVNNDLAVQMGAALDEMGYVRTTRDCEVVDENDAPIHGLYAVGDVRAGNWKQVPIGFGDAENAIIHAYARRL